MAQTRKLTWQERHYKMPELKQILEQETSTDKTLYADQLCERLNVPKPVLMKMINELRSTSSTSIISGKRGYYFSQSDDEIDIMVNSLKERADAIIEAANGLIKYKNNLKIEQDLIAQQQGLPHNKLI